MQNFKLTIPAGRSVTQTLKGRYIRYVTGNAGGLSALLNVTTEGGGITPMLPGQAETFDNTHTLWVFANPGGADITAEFVIGNGRFDDSRVTGEVSVVDGGRARSMASIAFGGAVEVVASAAKYGIVQLINTSTDKRIVVESVQFGAAADAKMFVGSLGTPVISSVGGVGAAKYSANAVDSNMSLIGGPYDSVVGGGTQMYVKGMQMERYEPSSPIILAPSGGITVQCGLANTSMLAMFDWFEEALA